MESVGNIAAVPISQPLFPLTCTMIQSLMSRTYVLGSLNLILEIWYMQ